MNIPLINTNDKESINTSLIAIKRATEELNNLIKIADEKMAQLDEKAKKYTDDKINALDVASVGGSGKYISAIEETDGKISATASNLDTTVTPSSTQPVTSGAVASSIEGNTIYNPCYNNGYTTFNIDTVGAGHRTYVRTAVGGGTSGNCPSDYGVVYTITANETAWKFQIAKETFSDTTYTRQNINDGGWTAWQKVANTNNLRGYTKQLRSIKASDLGYTPLQDVAFSDFVYRIVSLYGDGIFDIKFLWDDSQDITLVFSDNNRLRTSGATLSGNFTAQQPWVTDEYTIITASFYMYCAFLQTTTTATASTNIKLVLA